jgi:hypothetical protein
VVVINKPAPVEEQRMFSISQAAPLLGLTETALRCQVFRGRVNVVKLGKRTMISRLEIERLSGLAS